MLKSTALAAYEGSVSAVAEALGVSISAVSSWGEVVPEGSAYKLQVVSGGRAVVDPTLYEKRPKRGQTLAAAT